MEGKISLKSCDMVVEESIIFFPLDHVASRGKDAPAAAPKADTSLDYTDIPVAQIRKVLFTPLGDESSCSQN